MKDRISKAYQLRHALHTFLKTNRNATVAQIFAALPDTRPEAIRKALRHLRVEGSIEMDGARGRAATYRIVTETIQPESAMREKMAAGARTVHRDRYERAYQLRVRILDYMESVAPIGCPDLALAIGITIDHANRTCNAMVREGTLSRTGFGKHITYAITGEPPITADVQRERVNKLRSESSRDSHHIGKIIGGPGSKVHVGGELKSTAQGGQGAIRRVVGIASCMAA